MALAVALVDGCAATTAYPPPTQAQFAAVEGALTKSRAEGAERDAQAMQHLQFAERQLVEARQRLAAGDNQSAALLLAKADADADLSQALQQQAEATTEARTTETELRQTRATLSPQP